MKRQAPPALTGIRVVDLSRLLPGPMCSWYLQGLGARVIKVEEPGPGDYLRYVPPFTESGQGAWFQALNAGKRSVALDLRRPTHQGALLALLKDADVLVESFRPGVLGRLGLDPDDLRQRFPRLVIASISGFGQDGGWEDLPGHDLGYCALAGALSMATRHGPGNVPDVPGIQLADVAGGALTGALGIAAALYRRERTGEGDWLDISMTDGVLPFLGPVLAATAAGEPLAPGQGPITGGAAFYRVYACADGKLISFAAIEPKFQEAARVAFRAVAGEDVPLEEAALERIFARLPRDEWAIRLAQACAVPVLELEEVLRHPLHRARGSIRGEGAGSRVAPPLPGDRDFVLEPAPTVGEHTRAELAAVGYDPAALEPGR